MPTPHLPVETTRAHLQPVPHAIDLEDDFLRGLVRHGPSTDIAEDEQRVAGRVREWFQMRYGRPGMEQGAVWGPPATCLERLREVIEAGAQLILLDAPFDHAEQLERFASEIAPGL